MTVQMAILAIKVRLWRIVHMHFVLQADRLIAIGELQHHADQGIALQRIARVGYGEVA